MRNPNPMDLPGSRSRFATAAEPLATPGASVTGAPGAYLTIRPAISGSSPSVGMALTGADGGVAPCSLTARTVNS